MYIKRSHYSDLLKSFERLHACKVIFDENSVNEL